MELLGIQHILTSPYYPQDRKREIFRECLFYVPALALQATMYSCTRQKGRKDSDGRVQDIR